MEHQDWGEVKFVRRGRPAGESKRTALAKAKLAGRVATEKKYGAATNKAPIGAASANMKKLDDDHETFAVQRSGLALGRALQQARQEKSMTQKELATAMNVKPTVITEYEQGKAVPNPQLISRMERILGAKLPRPPKKPKARK